MEEIIKNLKGAREDLKQLNDILINDYIERNQEEIYQKYCEIFPEKITSDFMLEDIDDLVGFVEMYL